MTKKRASQHQQHHRTPRAVDHVSDSDDEEIPEDEAFNSDDERKYGAFFEQQHDDDDDDSEVSSSSSGDESMSDDGIASDDEDEEGDGGQYMLDLLDKLDGPNNKKEDSSGGPARHQLASTVAESEFAASVVKHSNLTLDALMEGLQDTQGFGKMQKTMEKVVQSKAPAVPLAKSIADRASRKVHYEHETEQIARWMEAVQQNRQAETLDFRHKERLGDVTKEQLVEKFVPTTDFEKELHEALMNAGQQDEDAILKREQALQEDDLGSNTLTMEEYKKRQGQLAKMRALMFYHEQKRHHMNKIKSKKYRRIRKRQRQRQKEAETEAGLEENPDLARELEEKEEVERMKERMTLAHKNTSKWAKRVLKRGKNVDVDTRRALSAQLKRGDDLRKKMNSTRGGNNSSDEEGDEDLVEMARKVLEDSGDDQIPMKSPGLFKLSFMQKEIEAQRERAKEEARQLLRELQANEDVPDSDDDSAKEEPGRASDTRKIASEEVMKDLISDGNMVAKPLQFGNSSAIAVSGGVDIEIPFGDGLSDGKRATGSRQTTSQHSTTMQVDAPLDGKVADITPQDSRLDARRANSKQAASKATTRVSNDDEANPWMQSGVQVDDNADIEGTSKKQRARRSKAPGVVDVDGAVDALGEAGPREEAVNVGEKQSAPAQSKATSTEKTIVMLSQEELVRRAFATAEAKDVEEEFAQEKQAVEERDDPTRKKAAETKTVSGWGSWAGEGAPVLKPRRNLPKRLQPPEKKLPKRKREDEKKPNVIINEKRQKKTANQFQIAEIPYPYTSREEYERAMVGGIGREWNVSSGVKNLTRPAIMTRPGKIILPISKKVKQKRPAAKF